MKKHSFRAKIGAVLLGAAMVTPLGVNAAFAQNSAFTQSAEDGNLDWGIRTSFNNYTGGATQLLDGVTKNTNGFTFKLASKKYEAATNLTDLQFNGTVAYRKYCDNPEKPLEGNCALDLKFQNPRVVISDTESYLEAKVYSKQYPSGGVYAPADPVHIAKLHTASATMTVQDGRVNWSNIATTLTEAGNKMFSEFYSVGEALDPLSISYLGEGSRPASDSGKPTLSDARWDSKKEYTDGPHILVDADPYVLVGEPGGHLVLLDENLKELARTETNISKEATYAYDKKSKLVYYTALDKATELRAVKIENNTFSKSELVTTAVKNIAAIGVNGAGQVAAVAVSQNYEEATLLTNASGAFAEMALPSSQELLGDKYVSGSIWGGSSFKEHAELAAMNDNTFVYNSEGSPYLSDDTSRSAKGLLVSIDATGKTPADRAKFMAGSHHGDGSAYVRNLVTNGEIIYRFNVSPYGRTTTTEILKYANRDVSSVIPVSKDGIAGIAAIAFAPDGTPVLQEGSTGSLRYLKPNTFETVSTLPLPNGKSTQKSGNNTFIVRNNAIFVPTFDESRGDYREYYVLRKFVLPVPESTPIAKIDEEHRLKEIAEKAKAKATADARAALAKAEKAAANAVAAEKEIADARVLVALAKLKEAEAKFDSQVAAEKSLRNPTNQVLAAEKTKADLAYAAAQQVTLNAETALAKEIADAKVAAEKAAAEKAAAEKAAEKAAAEKAAAEKITDKPVADKAKEQKQLANTGSSASLLPLGAVALGVAGILRRSRRDA
ncbi:HtaA domain-containing protein [Canibacter sp. lx-72]|uniref:HtaA domain-containing protein n=1 Tax=Canibacter zhuwentaonis TaxID=2837491 RepID=UPI001BDC4991|nr:HtaA domain-containing protein [Canibacter zhuwentaonis]MBT1017720.1 HtaA domain-containing protein [Canibacter zhuwentaonis]